MPKPAKWKRKGPKSTRAGCMLCKPHKHQANNRTAIGATTHGGNLRRMTATAVDLRGWRQGA